MCDFKPGDEVVCVDAGPPSDGGPMAPLILNAIYTIKDLSDFADPYGDWGVTLVELPDPVHHLGFFSARRFRKVQKRNDRLTIEAFLTIKPGQFEEPKRAPAKKRERVR